MFSCLSCLPCLPSPTPCERHHRKSVLATAIRDKKPFERKSTQFPRKIAQVFDGSFVVGIHSGTFSFIRTLFDLLNRFGFLPLLTEFAQDMCERFKRFLAHAFSMVRHSLCRIVFFVFFVFYVYNTSYFSPVFSTRFKACTWPIVGGSCPDSILLMVLGGNKHIWLSWTCVHLFSTRLDTISCLDSFDNFFATTTSCSMNFLACAESVVCLVFACACICVFFVLFGLRIVTGVQSCSMFSTHETTIERRHFFRVQWFPM